MRGGFKKVFKFTQCAGANYVALITDEIVGSFFVLVEINVEVVEPEVGHDFLKLGAGIDIASQALACQLLNNHALGIFEGGNELALDGSEIGDQRGVLRGLEGLAEAVELGLAHGSQTKLIRCDGGRARMRPIWSWGNGGWAAFGARQPSYSFGRNRLARGASPLRRWLLISRRPVAGPGSWIRPWPEGSWRG